jgi:hypothetical protein
MSHIQISNEGLHSFTLTHEQVNHIAVSLASDIGAAESLMPRDFLECHLGLLEMFLDLLSAKEKFRIMASVSAVRVSQ